MAEFKEKSLIGYISKSDKSGWVTKFSELEVSDTKDTKIYYDIRKMKENEDPYKQIFGKGISLSLEELKNLYSLLNEFFKE
ncbi:MAG: PC4/YdbC family ssDNA-binding protein [Candidatus Nanoarchaeia archaeon]|nr:PC4/YdbC family ssDNA-binding protein [Candidatus Nanoarchaeia archaeon]